MDVDGCRKPAMMLMAACGTSKQVQGTGKVDAGKQHNICQGRRAG